VDVVEAAVASQVNELTDHLVLLFTLVKQKEIKNFQKEKLLRYNKRNRILKTILIVN